MSCPFRRQSTGAGEASVAAHRPRRRARRGAARGGPSL